MNQESIVSKHLHEEQHFKEHLHNENDHQKHLEYALFAVIGIVILEVHKGQEDDKLQLVTQIPPLEVADTCGLCLDHFITEEEQLGDVTDKVAPSAHISIVVEDDQEKWSHEEHDV